MRRVSGLLLGWIFRLNSFLVEIKLGFPLNPQNVKLFAEGSAATIFFVEWVLVLRVMLTPYQSPPV